MGLQWQWNVPAGYGQLSRGPRLTHAQVRGIRELQMRPELVARHQLDQHVKDLEVCLER